MDELADVIAEADRLNRILNNLMESKNSRNAALTLLRDLEQQYGMELRWGCS